MLNPRPVLHEHDCADWLQAAADAAKGRAHAASAADTLPLSGCHDAMLALLKM
jgi:hypothetical protein